MRLRTFAVVASLLILSMSAVAQNLTPEQKDAIGHWQIIKNNRATGAEVITYLENGKLLGKIIKGDTDKDPNGVCTKCSGELRDKKIVGMVFLRGFSPDGDGWSGGTVDDPDNGKEYRGKIKSLGKDKLYLRGYVGIPMFGRTETWNRLP